MAYRDDHIHHSGPKHKQEDSAGNRERRWNGDGTRTQTVAGCLR
jgi:hypothetical protein